MLPCIVLDDCYEVWTNEQDHLHLLLFLHFPLMGTAASVLQLFSHMPTWRGIILSRCGAAIEVKSAASAALGSASQPLFFSILFHPQVWDSGFISIPYNFKIEELSDMVAKLQLGQSLNTPYEVSGASFPWHAVVYVQVFPSRARLVLILVLALLMNRHTQGCPVTKRLLALCHHFQCSPLFTVGMSQPV